MAPMSHAATISRLSVLAREGRLCAGDTHMAELFTSQDEAPPVRGVSVDSVLFAKDGTRVRQWNISVRGISSDEVYAGGIVFPPEYPARPPTLVVADSVGAGDLCGTLINNARAMNGFDMSLWGKGGPLGPDQRPGSQLDDVDESLELDLVPAFSKERGVWKAVLWSQFTTVFTVLERVRDFLHKGLTFVRGLEGDDVKGAAAAAEDDGIRLPVPPLDHSPSKQRTEGGGPRPAAPTAEAVALEGASAMAHSVVKLERLHACSAPVLLCSLDGEWGETGEGNGGDACGDGSRHIGGRSRAQEDVQGGENQVQHGREGAGQGGPDWVDDDRQREEATIEALSALFRERDVRWRWSTLALTAGRTHARQHAETHPNPRTPAGGASDGVNVEHAEGVGAGGEGLGPRRGLAVQSLSVDDIDAERVEGGSGHGEGVEVEGDPLLGAWVVVLVVGERWRLPRGEQRGRGGASSEQHGEREGERSTGSQGGGVGGGSWLRRCRALLHESNRFVLVVRLRSWPPYPSADAGDEAPARGGGDVGVGMGAGLGSAQGVERVC